MFFPVSILEDTACRRLRIECPEMSLTKIGENELGFGGPGAVWTNQIGEIQFEIRLAEEAAEIYRIAALRQQFDVHEDPKDTDYFALKAVSSSGEIYTGRILYPERADQPSRAKGKLNYLESTQEVRLTEQSSARILISKKLNIPAIQHLEEKAPRKDY
jgi:hypothetical protein